MDFYSSKKRVYQTIVEHIKSAIENRDLLPGDKLPSERALATKLSVSRTSIKEAFSVLQSAGLLEVRHGSGAVLLNDNSEDIIMKMNMIIRKDSINIVELMELRQAIECEAASLAAIRSTSDDIVKLETSYNKLAKAVSANNIAANEDLDFHMCIARSARNLLFIEVMYMLSDRLLLALRDSRTETIKQPGKSEVILKEHAEIFEAIKERNPKMARQAMNKHLINVKQRYL